MRLTWAHIPDDRLAMAFNPSVVYILYAKQTSKKYSGASAVAKSASPARIACFPSKSARQNQNCDNVFWSRMLRQRGREKSVNHGRRYGQARYFGILRSKEFTSRILLAQFPKQFLREDKLSSASLGHLPAQHALRCLLNRSRGGSL